MIQAMNGSVIFKRRLALLVGMLLLLNVVPTGGTDSIALGRARSNNRLAHVALRSTPRAAPRIARATTISSAAASPAQRYVSLTGADTSDCSNSAQACRTI